MHVLVSLCVHGSVCWGGGWLGLYVCKCLRNCAIQGNIHHFWSSSNCLLHKYDNTGVKSFNFCLSFALQVIRKRRRNIKVVRVTVVQRRKWMLEGLPEVADVVKTFPCFTRPRFVSYQNHITYIHS